MKRSVLFILLLSFISITSRSQDTQSLLSALSPSVVMLKTDGVVGNGVCIAPDKLVCPLSSIGKYSYGRILLPNGKHYTLAGYTYLDTDNDFVLLQTESDSLAPIAMADYLPVIGQKVFLAHRDSIGALSLAEGRLSDVKDFGAVKLIQVNASTQLMASGLPVVDSLGNMIGLSVMPPVEDPSSNFSIPVELIRKASEKEGTLRTLDNLQALTGNLNPVSFNSKTKSKEVSDFLDMGTKKLAKKDYTGAIEKFNMALRINQADADAFAFRGQARIQLKEYKDALDDFNKALELQPGYAEVLDMRGICKAELGDMKGACDDWKQSFELGYNPAFKLLEKYCDLE